VPGRPASPLPSLFAAPPGQLTGVFMSDPLGFMRRMSEEMNQIFESAGLGGTLAGAGSAGRTSGTGWMPQVEVRQRGSELVVRADLPGLEPDDVRVEVENNVLTVSGERRQEDEDEREGYFRSERSYGSFFRSIPLPEGVEEESIKASFDRGVLEVRVPIPEQQQRRGRRIEINRQ
jgi:HSP20 family protein